VAPAAAVIAALLLASPRAQLDAGVATSAHAASDYPGPLGPDAARSLDVEPAVKLLLQEPALRVQTEYAAGLLLTGPGESGIATRHTGSLAFAWKQSPNLELVSSNRFRYGRSVLALDPGLRRPFDSLEGLLPLVDDELFADGELGFSFVPARRLTLDVAAGYFAYGGASAASQHLVPLQQGPQLYVGLTHELTRNDQIGAEIYASHTVASDDHSSSLLRSAASWRRQLDAATQAKISLGASLDQRSQAAQSSFDAFPLVGAELQHDFLERTRRVELRTLAALEPHYSLLTADLQERAQLEASARFVLRERFWVRLRGAAARDLLAAGGAHLWVAALDTALQLRNDLVLTAGAERLWQQVAAGTPVPSAAWVAFASLSFTARDVL
jgi:hypothetical protein